MTGIRLPELPQAGEPPARRADPTPSSAPEPSPPEKPSPTVIPKVPDPAAPTEPAEPAEPSERAEPTEPAEPAEPAEPVASAVETPDPVLSRNDLAEGTRDRVITQDDAVLTARWWAGEGSQWEAQGVRSLSLNLSAYTYDSRNVRLQDVRYLPERYDGTEWVPVAPEVWSATTVMAGTSIASPSTVTLGLDIGALPAGTVALRVTAGVDVTVGSGARPLTFSDTVQVPIE